MTGPDIDAAEQVLAANARVLERRRFARLFRGGGGAVFVDPSVKG